ncbi:C40 family peptidase [Actinomadura sp. LCR2-06]|uniref:C40 family peptidase n=1 Tax=Actinomadura violacea TaxID=2819934 RepID=A0ABS3RWA2_9ACTN|nr:C40 family peptidase [Actinomadura violacea]
MTAGPAGAATNAPQRTALAALATKATTSKATATKTVATQSRAAKQNKRATAAVKYAYKQIGDPYRYGGSGPGSWDCSGLAQGSWRKAGVKLPRTTQQIYRAVKHKVSWKGAKAGDLLFFYSGRTHVGIYVGHGYMIHAPHSGSHVKKIKLTHYYKSQFNGGVRPGY